MRPESLVLVLEAARINPHVTVAALAADVKYGDALIDLYAQAEGAGSKAFSPQAWDDFLESVDADPRPIGEYIDTPPVRALIRAQEAGRADI